MRGNEHFSQAQVQGITDKAETLINQAIAKAEKLADDAWKKLSDAFEATFYPETHRHKERNSKYKTAMNALIKEAQAAAATGDYVSAYAIAKAAQSLGQMPPYTSWPQISSARAQMTEQARLLGEAYAGKAGAQMDKGKGGTYSVGGLSLGIAAAGIAVVALFLSMRKGS
jgi:hypothetical protein|tara:strand:- start:19 stop:528 length:510 start_codon:yes stop_codon:yes gene_type:complete